MSTNFFIDSEVILKALNRKDFEDALHMVEVLLEAKKIKDIKIYINIAVEIELIEKLVLDNNSLTLEELELFLSAFDKLFLTEEIEKEYLKIEGKYQIYSLSPRKALILATCKFYKVKYLVTFSQSFKEIALKEGLTVVDRVEKLGKILAKELQRSII